MRGLFLLFTFCLIEVSPVFASCEERLEGMELLSQKIELGGEEYTLICSGEELYQLSGQKERFGENFALGRDIDLAKYTGDRQFRIGFGSIGLEEEGPFTGVFDGQGHSITNYTFKSSGTRAFFNGLFGETKEATIRNLVLVNPSVQGKIYTGALVGKAINSKIEHIKIINGRVGGHQVTGLLVGGHYRDEEKKDDEHQEGSIENILLIGAVKNGSTHLGGIVGHNYYSISQVRSYVRFYSRFGIEGLAVGYNEGAELKGVQVAKLKNYERESLFTNFRDRFFECGEDYFSYRFLQCDSIAATGNHFEGERSKNGSVLVIDESQAEKELSDYLRGRELTEMKLGKSCALSLVDNPLNLFSDKCIPLWFANEAAEID